MEKIDQAHNSTPRPGVNPDTDKDQQISENHLYKIISFAANVSNLIIFLKSAKALQHLQNPVLITCDLISKYPCELV